MPAWPWGVGKADVLWGWLSRAVLTVLTFPWVTKHVLHLQSERDPPTPRRRGDAPRSGQCCECCVATPRPPLVMKILFVVCSLLCRPFGLSETWLLVCETGKRRKRGMLPSVPLHKGGAARAGGHLSGGTTLHPGDRAQPSPQPERDHPAATGVRAASPPRPQTPRDRGTRWLSPRSPGDRPGPRDRAGTAVGAPGSTQAPPVCGWAWSCRSYPLRPRPRKSLGNLKMKSCEQALDHALGRSPWISASRRL